MESKLRKNSDQSEISGSSKTTPQLESSKTQKSTLDDSQKLKKDTKHQKSNTTVSSNHNSSANVDSQLKIGNNESGSDCDEDVMTGSYGEISLDQDLHYCDKNSDSDEQDFFDELQEDEIPTKDKNRPATLVLGQNVPSSSRSKKHQSQQTSEGRSFGDSPSLSSEEFAIHSRGHVRTGSDTSGLSELQGTLTVDGDLVTFVAEDLQEKIKLSSPVSKWADSSFVGSRSSTPSLYRQALQPSHHIIDPTVLDDLESHAKKVATCVDTMLENLSGTLQSISSLTVDCMETYESSVFKTCDAVDANIKSVYQLMAKSEELNNSMAPLYKLSHDVKHIKKVLEQLEQIERDLVWI